MRSAAQVDIVIPGIVNSDLFVFRKVLNQLGLELLILEELKRLRSADLPAGPVFLPLQDLMHLVLDRCEIRLGDRLSCRKHKVIVRAILDLRSDRILNVFPVDLNHSLRQHMGKGVAVYRKILFLIHNRTPFNLNPTRVLFPLQCFII